MPHSWRRQCRQDAVRCSAVRKMTANFNGGAARSVINTLVEISVLSLGAAPRPV